MKMKVIIVFKSRILTYLRITFRGTEVFCRISVLQNVRQTSAYNYTESELHHRSFIDDFQKFWKNYFKEHMQAAGSKI